MTIAVLALQGAFAEHEKMIRSLGADCIELRQAEDLKKHYDGLILPGGESPPSQAETAAPGRRCRCPPGGAWYRRTWGTSGRPRR